MTQHTPPKHGVHAFNCAHCGVYSRQVFYQSVIAQGANDGSANQGVENFTASRCDHCGKDTLWRFIDVVYPRTSTVPLPNPDMPENVQQEYLEASSVLADSPRSAAALLRLGIEKLCKELLEHEPANGLNEQIKKLVERGLSPKIQKALDFVRVIGNNAVHPGQIDLRDDVETAATLFALVNLIVESQITQPRDVDRLYEQLPQQALDQIARRDKNS